MKEYKATINYLHKGMIAPRPVVLRIEEDDEMQAVISVSKNVMLRVHDRHKPDLSLVHVTIEDEHHKVVSEWALNPLYTRERTTLEKRGLYTQTVYFAVPKGMPTARCHAIPDRYGKPVVSTSRSSLRCDIISMCMRAPEYDIVCEISVADREMYGLRLEDDVKAVFMSRSNIKAKAEFARWVKALEEQG